MKKKNIYIFIFRNFHSKQMVRCDDITLCLKQENLNLGEWKFQLTFPNLVLNGFKSKEFWKRILKWWNEFNQWYVQRNNDKRERKIILGKIDFSDDIDSLLEDESERMLRKRGCIEACLFHRLALVRIEIIIIPRNAIKSHFFITNKTMVFTWNEISNIKKFRTFDFRWTITSSTCRNSMYI